MLFSIRKWGDLESSDWLRACTWPSVHGSDWLSADKPPEGAHVGDPVSI